MRIARLELSGFRGVRDQLKIDFPKGFVVLSGRNGSGKSSVCDAIEFALTGTIAKYPHESEKGEGVQDYLWWRGKGQIVERYVSLTVADEHGQEWTLTRRPEGVNEPVLEQLLARVCLRAVDPTKGFRDVCTTSIIRDESITQLSVDLAETERFAFVRAAVGSANFSTVERKLNEVSEIAKKRTTAATREYDTARNRVRDLVAEISRLRSETAEDKEVQAAEQLLRNELPVSSRDVPALLAAGRSKVADLRLLIDATARLQDRSQSYRARLKQQAIVEQRTRIHDLTTSVARMEEVQRGTRQRLEILEPQLQTAQDANSGQSSLAILRAHGAKVGLQDERCPLCGSKISAVDFEKHLKEIDAALQGAAALTTTLASERARLGEAERTAAVELAGLRRQLEQSRSVIEQFEQEGSRLRQESRRLGFTGDESSDPDPGALALWLEQNRRRSAQLERAVAVLESSTLLGRVSELEEELALTQKVSVDAERQLEVIKSAERRVKEAGATLKRVASEQIDERLASISPLLSELYVRLRPHIEWPQINYLIRGDVRRFLSLRVGEGEGHNLRFMFSSGQRRAVGLAFLLSISLSRPWCALKSIVLDDPVQHIDDYRALHLVEALAGVRKSGHQVICTVEDAELGELLARRLRSTIESPGALVTLQYNSGGGVTLEKVTQVQPFPVQILRSA